MKKNLLIVEAGFQEYKEAIVKMLFETGEVDIYFATGLEPNISSDWIKPYATGRFKFSYPDNNLIEVTRNFAVAHGIKFDGALTYIQTSVHVVNELQHALGLPVVSALRGKAIRNKLEMRKLFAAEGVRQPQFQSAQMPTALEFPLVVKPAEMMGSLAVRKAKNHAELKSAIDKAASADFADENLRGLYGDISSEVLLEEFLAGPEYSAEALIVDGETEILGVTEKVTTSGNQFDELAHTFPKELSVALNLKVQRLVTKAHRALKLKNSATHVEFKIVGSEPYLIEVNCRLAGDLITELVRRSGFAKLASKILETCFGARSSVPGPINLTPNTIRFFATAIGGRVLRLPELPKHVVHHFSSGVGSVVNVDPQTGLTRIGYILGETDVVDQLYDSTAEEIEFGDRVLNESGRFFIERALIDDVESLIEIENAAWGTHALSRDGLRARLESRRCKTLNLRAKNDGELLGFATFLSAEGGESEFNRPWTHYANECLQPLDGQGQGLFIISISVKPGAQSGVGSALTAAVARYASTHGYSRVSYGARMTAATSDAGMVLEAKDVFAKIEAGAIIEPSVKMGLNSGYVICHLLENYFEDSASKNFGILMSKTL